MKKIRTTVAVIAAVGTLVLALSACQGQTEPTSQEEYDSNASVVTSSSESEDSPALDETISLEPFKHINISVMATSIRLEVGDSYRVGYHLHDKEQIDQMGVSDGTFSLTTEKNITGKPGGGPWEVVVTVPKDAALERIDLYTAAGDLTLSDVTCMDGHIETNGGTITLNNVSAQELELEAISKDITVTDSTIQELSAETVSGKISANGVFDELDLETVSGTCDMTGTVKREGDFSTVSGDLTVTTPAGAIEAESIGGVTIDGTDRGKKVEQPGGQPELDLESTSGKITLNTK